VERGKNQRVYRSEDLDWELLGRVVSTSSYWVKIESSSVALYVNKPFIVYVRVLEGHVERLLRATHR